MSAPEETMPPVSRGCKKCGVTEKHIEEGRVVVSNKGVAHYDAGYGMTVCGKDATGSGWWWPL